MTRAPRPLTDSVHRQVNIYALAAGAAGVSVLALTQPSEARIVYTPADQKIAEYHLDLNHDGISDFFLQTTYHKFNETYSIHGLKIKPSNKSNAVRGLGKYASALRIGVRIGPGFHHGGKIMAQDFYEINAYKTFFHGPWANNGKGVQSHFLGLQFVIKGRAHFGWARLNVRIGDFGVITATLTGYAYETISGKAIIAGATKGPDDDVQPDPASMNRFTPEPATLGMLALGAPGLSIWRREESAVATP